MPTSLKHLTTKSKLLRLGHQKLLEYRKNQAACPLSQQVADLLLQELWDYRVAPAKLKIFNDEEGKVITQILFDESFEMAGYYFKETQELGINEKYSPAQAVSTLFHELVHALQDRQEWTSLLLNVLNQSGKIKQYEVAGLGAWVQTFYGRLDQTEIEAEGIALSIVWGQPIGQIGPFAELDLAVRIGRGGGRGANSRSL